MCLNFVTSDQKLQLWDSRHSTNQPLTLLPSQWMGLILKYVSRSSDDYKSFISFMNLPKDNSLISEDELQSVMAGISEMTEEFSKQESIIENMIEIKFGDILKGNIQENAKAFAKNRLEEDFAQQMLQKEVENQKEKDELSQMFDAQMNQIREEARKQIERIDREKKLNEAQYITKDIERLQTRKNKIEQKVDDRRTLIKTLLYGGYSLFVIVWIILIIKLGWNKMEMWTYILGLPSILISRLYMSIKGKDFSIDSYIENICSRYQQNLYESFDYFPSELNELIERKKELDNFLPKIH